MDPTSELSQFYSSRLDHFQSQLISLVHRITQDELLSQFTQNPLSQEFYFDRIKEIIEESLNLEQESSIETLMKSNVFLKTEIKRIEDELSMKNEEISDFKQRFMRLEGENEKERKIIEILEKENKGFLEKNRKNAENQAEILEIKEQQLNYEKSLFLQEIDGLKSELQGFNEKIGLLKSEISQKDEKIRTLSSENLSLQAKTGERMGLLTENEALKRKIMEKTQEKTMNEGHFMVRSQDFEGLMLKKSQELEELKIRSNEKINSLKEKLKEKDQEIEEFSLIKANLMEKLQKETENKAFYEEKIRTLQEKKLDTERKSDVNKEKSLQNEDFRLLKLEKDYELKLKSLENELKSSFEAERSEFQVKIRNFQANYVSLNELLRKQSEFEKTLESLKAQAQEKISFYEEELRKKTDSERNLERNLEKSLKEFEAKSELLKEITQENTSLKNEIKDLRFSETKSKEIRKKAENQAFDDEKRENQRLNKELKAKSLEIEDLLGSINKLKEKLRSVNKEKEEIAQEKAFFQEKGLDYESRLLAWNHEKKSLEQEIIKEKSLNSSLNREIEALKVEIKEKEGLIRGLQEKNLQEIKAFNQRSLDENEAKFREIEKLRVSNEKYEKINKELIVQIKQKDQEKMIFIEKTQELEEEVKKSIEFQANNIKLKDQLTRKNRVLNEYKKKLSEIRLFLRNSKLSSLKTSFQTFAKGLKIAIEGFRTGLSEVFQVKGNSFQRFMNKRTEENQSFFNESLRKYEYKLQKLSEQFKQEIENLTHKNKAFEGENEILNERNKEICEEKSRLIEKFGVFSEENEELKQKVMKQVEEMANIREFYNNAMGEFNTQQNFTKKTIERIRNEMKGLFMRKMREMEKGQKKELLGINEKVKGLKESHIDILNGLKEDVEGMKKEAAKGMNRELDIRSKEIEDLKLRLGKFLLFLLFFFFFFFFFF